MVLHTNQGRGTRASARAAVGMRQRGRSRGSYLHLLPVVGGLTTLSVTDSATPEEDIMRYALHRGWGKGRNAQKKFGSLTHLT
jgi:hypothetical protein